MTNTEFLWENLRWRVGPKPDISPQEIWENKWSPKFEQLMRNRLFMGSLRYDLPSIPLEAGIPMPVDYVDAIQRRLDQYKATGNQEFLVDIANIAMVEFWQGTHPSRHFEASDHHMTGTEHGNKRAEY